MNKTGVRYNNLDLFKFIMAVVVIALHTEPLKYCKDVFTISVFNSLAGMAVPFFFLCSGYLLGIRMTREMSSEDDMIVLRQHNKKLLKLYVIWSVIYLPITIYHFATNQVRFINSLFWAFRGYVFVGEQYNSWHLWYLLSSIYVMMLTMILVRFKLLDKLLPIIVGFFSVLSVSVDWVMMMPKNSNNIVFDLVQKVCDFTIANGRIFGGFIYIPIGIIISKEVRKSSFFSSLSKIVIFLCALVTKCIVDSFFLSFYLQIVISVVFFSLVKDIRLSDNWIYPYLRQLSMMLYLIHMYVWTIYYMTVYGEKTYGVNSFVITSIITLAIGIMYVMLGNRISWRKGNTK